MHRPDPQAGPDLNLVRLLHRGPGSHVAFGCKINGEWKDLFELQATDLYTTPAEALEYLRGADVYMSLNGFDAGRGQSKFVPTLRRPFRRYAGLRFLNACFADCDLHNTNLNVESVIAELHTMEQAGTIPKASVVVKSGRGVWVLFLLADPATGLPPQAETENRRRYRAIQAAINAKLSHMGSDPSATDATRMTRLPGSLHSEAARRVEWELQADLHGSPRVYSLDQLAEAFGVPPELPQQLPGEAPEHPPRSPTEQPPSPARSGWMNVNKSRLRQLRKLEQLRGGFAEGHRNRAAFILAATLARLGEERAEVYRQVAALGSACRPPLSAGECRNATRSGTMMVKLLHGQQALRFRFTNQTISNWLNITPAEAAKLESWKPSSRFPPDTTTRTTTRPERARARHKLIVWLIEQGGGVVPSVRVMAKLLKEHGHQVGRSTVHYDFELLGLAGTGVGVSASTATPSNPLAA